MPKVKENRLEGKHQGCNNLLCKCGSEVLASIVECRRWCVNVDVQPYGGQLMEQQPPAAAPPPPPLATLGFCLAAAAAAVTVGRSSARREGMREGIRRDSNLSRPSPMSSPSLPPRSRARKWLKSILCVLSSPAKPPTERGASWKGLLPAPPSSAPCGRWGPALLRRANDAHQRPASASGKARNVPRNP